MQSSLGAPLAALLLISCNSSSRELREWRPSDHDQVPQASQAAPDRGSQSRGAAGAPDGGTPSEVPPNVARVLAHQGLTEGILKVWVDQCARCHGTIGRGDGPQGAVTGAKDLSNAEWQKSTTDDQIAQIIQKGKGMMPAFQFSPEELQGLTNLVRLFGQHAQNPSTIPPTATPNPVTNAATP